MTFPLMPKATAVWLVDNTTLTFEQISVFCGLHLLEVQGIADRETVRGMLGVDPIKAGQLSKEEIIRCEGNPSAHLKLSSSIEEAILAEQKKNLKGGRYIPMTRRQDKPDAIMWFLKNCPEISESQIVKLIGTTKNTIASIKNKTHWNYPNIKQKDPVLLGLCAQTELNYILELAQKTKTPAKETK